MLFLYVVCYQGVIKKLKLILSTALIGVMCFNQSLFALAPLSSFHAPEVPSSASYFPVLPDSIPVTFSEPWAHAEGMPLLTPALISKNGEQDIELIRSSVKTRGSRLEINETTFFIDPDLLNQYERLGFKNQKEFLEYLKAVLTPKIFLNPPAQKEIVITLLDSSEFLFEDHHGNGFIGVNRQLFERLVESLQTAKSLLKIGLLHELAHESLVFERKVLLEHFQEAEGLLFAQAAQRVDQFIQANQAQLQEKLKKLDLWDKVEAEMLEAGLRQAQSEALDVSQVARSGLLRPDAPFVVRYLTETRSKFADVLEIEIETLEEQHGLVDENDPVYQELNTIFKNILKAAGLDPSKIDLYVVNSDEIEAYWIKDSGAFFIHIGLIKTLKKYLEENNKELTQDAIAWIFGHEIQHLIQYKEGKEVVAGAKSSDARQKNQNLEYDADNGGLFLAAYAGYNPNAAVEVLAFLDALGNAPPFISGHPKADNRVGEVQRILKSPDQFLPNVAKESQSFTQVFLESPVILESTKAALLYEALLEAKTEEELGVILESIDDVSILENFLTYSFFVNRFQTAYALSKDPDFINYLSYVFMSNNIQAVVNGQSENKSWTTVVWNRDWKLPLSIQSLFLYLSQEFNKGPDDASVSIGEDPFHSREFYVESIEKLIDERISFLEKTTYPEKEEKLKFLRQFKGGFKRVLRRGARLDGARVSKSHKDNYRFVKGDSFDDADDLDLKVGEEWVLSIRDQPKGSIFSIFVSEEEVYNNFERLWDYFEKEYDLEFNERLQQQRKDVEAIRMLGLKRWFRKKYGDLPKPSALFEIRVDHTGSDGEEKEQGRKEFLELYGPFLAFYFLNEKFGAFDSSPEEALPLPTYWEAIKNKAETLNQDRFQNRGLDAESIKLLTAIQHLSLYRAHDPQHDEKIEEKISQLSDEQTELVLETLLDSPSLFLSSMPSSIRKMLDYGDNTVLLQKKLASYYNGVVLEVLKKRTESRPLALSDLNAIFKLNKVFEIRYGIKVSKLDGYTQLLNYFYSTLLEDGNLPALKMLISEVGSNNSLEANKILISYLIDGYFPSQDYKEKINSLLRLFPVSSTTRDDFLEQILKSVNYETMNPLVKKDFLETILPLFHPTKRQLTGHREDEKLLHQRLALDYMNLLKAEGVGFIDLVQRLIQKNAVVTLFDLITKNQQEWGRLSLEQAKAVVGYIKGADDNGFETYQSAIGAIALAKVRIDVPLFLVTKLTDQSRQVEDSRGYTTSVFFYNDSVEDKENNFKYNLYSFVRKDGNNNGKWLFEGLSFQQSVSLVLELFPQSKERDSILIDLLKDFNPSEDEIIPLLEGLTPVEDKGERPTLGASSRFRSARPTVSDEMILSYLGIREMDADKAFTAEEIEQIIRTLSEKVSKKYQGSLEVTESLKRVRERLHEVNDRLAKLLKRDPRKFDRFGDAKEVDGIIVSFAKSYSVKENPYFDYFNLRDFGVWSTENFKLSLRTYKSLSSYFKDSNIAFEEKVARLKQIFPTKTIFRDNELFKLATSQAYILQRQEPPFWSHPFGIIDGVASYQSNDLLSTDGLSIDELSADQATELIDLYEGLIPLMSNSDYQVMLGRVVYELKKKYTPKIFRSFDSGLTEILKIFPYYSLARDNAFDEFINSTAVRSFAQLKEINKYLLEGNRVSEEQEIVSLQRKNEAWNTINKLPSRKERGDLVLWLLNPSLPMPESLVQLSLHNHVNFDSLPDIVFSMTKVERDKFFYDILRGYNGLFEEDSEEAPAEIKEFVQNLFDQLFLEDDLRGAQDILRDIFINVFVSYSTERRILLFNSLMNVFADKNMRQAGRAVKIRILLEQMGVIGVKVGQYLGEQPQLFKGATDIQHELGKLKKDAGSFHKRAIFQLLQEAGLIDEIQLKELLGSASIKQVYALLLRDYEGEVAGKFKRPAAEKFLKEDLSVLRSTLQVLNEKYPDLGLPTDMLEEIENVLNEELDFEKEALNVERYEANLESRPSIKGETFKIKVPKILSRSSRIILEEKVKGLVIEDLILLKQDPSTLSESKSKKQNELRLYLESNFTLPQQHALLNFDINQIQAELLNEFFLQVFGEGFFHADLHYGNAMITPEGEIYLIDWGAVGEIDPKKSQALLNLIISIDFKDAQKVIRLLTPFLGQTIVAGSLIANQLEAIVTSAISVEEKLNQLISIITKLEPSEELLIYLKGLASVAPVFDALPESLKKKVVSNYLTRSSKFWILVRSAWIGFKSVFYAGLERLNQQARPNSVIETSI